MMPVAGERYWNASSRRNQNFVTLNDEITKIESLVLQHTIPNRVIICGPGGVGKTQMVLELAYRIRKKDPEYSIFWFSSGSAANIEKSHLSIAHMLGFYEVEPAQAKSSVRDYLCQKQAGKCLLIFDDADDFLNLTEYLPQNEQVQILFTARDKNIVPKFTTDVTVVDLSTLSIEAALEMLQNSLTDKSLLDDQETAIALVQEYGFSPLAIAQIAAYINRKKINLSQFFYLFESKTEAISEEIEKRNKDSNDFLENALILKIQQIQQQNQLATDYISFMACMDPDIVPQSLLPPAKPEKRTEIIGLLKDSNIIQETVQGYYTLHRSMRRIIRDRMKSAQQFRQQVLKAADRLREVFPSNDNAKREIWREYLPHAMSLLAEVEFQEEQAKYTSFMRRVGRCLYSERRYSEAATIFETIMTIHKSQDSDTSSSTLSSMADLARTYEKQGHTTKVKELDLQILELSKRVLGTEYPDTLKIIRQSSVLQHQGKYEETEVRNGQAPEGWRKGFEPEHLDKVHYFSRLGSALDRQRKHEEAERLHRIAFGCLHKVFGTTHPYTLTVIFNISYTLIAQDKKEDAYTLLGAFIELHGKSLGPDHSNTEDASYCRGQWEDYYRTRLLRKQQYEKIRLNIPGKSQQIEDKAGTAPPNEQHSGTPAQRFIRDHPLLRASWSGQSVQEDHDLQKVD